MPARRIRSSSTTSSRASATGARLYAVDPRRTISAEWADVWLGLDVGSDIALANAVGREIIAAGLEDQRRSSSRATAGFEAYRAKVEPYTLEYAERETGVPADAIRDLAHAFATRRQGDDLLDARHHRAPQRGRQRPRADQPRAADRPRRPLRQRRQPAARPEQRPGRRRHGRPARPAARASSTSRTTRSARSSTPRGASPSRRSAAGTCRRCSTRWSAASCTAVYCIGENPVQSEADQHRAIAAARGPRLPRRPGPLPDEDRRARRRRPAGDRGVGREPRARSPTPSGASSACARPSTRRTRRATTCGSSSSSRDRMGHDWGEPAAEDVWNELRSLSPVHAGMSYARLERARRPPVAVLRRDAPGRAVPAQPAVGGPGARATACRSCRGPRPAGRQARRRLPDPPHDRPAPRLVQHGRPDGRLHVTAAARRVARHLARGRRRATASSMAIVSASSPAAVAWRRRSASTRRCDPGSRS